MLYAALMEALGYSQNLAPFLELAYRAPYSALKSVAIGSPPGDRVGLFQEVLLEAAGLLSPSPNTKAMSRNRWHLFRVRPQNHPRRRIMGFAHLLDLFLPSSEDSEIVPDGSLGQQQGSTGSNRPSIRGAGRHTPGPLPRSTGEAEGDSPLPWAQKGLVEGMSTLVRSSSGLTGRGECWRTLESGLMGIGQPIQGRNNGSKGWAPIGKGRAGDMAVNCVLPFLHAMARLEGDAQLEQLASEVYWKIPRLQENELTQEMAQQLFRTCRWNSPGATIDWTAGVKRAGEK